MNLRPLYPKQVRYQAAPLPDRKEQSVKTNCGWVNTRWGAVAQELFLENLLIVSIFKSWMDNLVTYCNLKFVSQASIQLQNSLRRPL